MTKTNKKWGESTIYRQTRAQVAKGLADVAEGLRWDLDQALDESTRLIYAAGITIIESCRLAVARAKDWKTVEKHFRTTRSALAQVHNLLARYRGRLDIPDPMGADAVH